MKNFWKDKVVWVTGASSGIGEALCIQLAERGAHLVLSSRREETLEALRATLPFGGNHRVVPLDVSNPENAEKTLAEHQDLCDRTDVLINNAGISQRSLTWDASSESERLIMETNFFGAIALTKAILPSMRKRNRGMIINMSSPTGMFGFPLRSSYAASKHALHGYFESLQAELRADQKDIHILMVLPGRVRTNMSLNAVMGDGTKQGKMDERLGAGLEPKDCARLILKAAEQKRAALYIGKEQILIYLKRYWPALFRRVVSKIKPN